ncbi:hypothetical protein C2845_PM13G12440 [Panicum miliaceum]|uniref:Protein FAR1-RELATED SEQUENCE n=1 Tax=Panicum miliaceum TaxID=4540 RepID=A0A3L6RL47_PANMI|nr:hypothetical protein C2845_PM13G12440 [Panicum miliaceum]
MRRMRDRRERDAGQEKKKTGCGSTARCGVAAFYGTAASVSLPSSWNYGAVERALRDAATRGERCIFEPTIGTKFDSADEAFEFYNMYSSEKGFGVRFGRSRSNQSGRRSRQDIVCACESSLLFWCHGSSRANYKCFGDAITFDTTFRTNLYNLPFGLFVGVNHHFQSIIFGAALLMEETTESFKWAFLSFVDAMDGIHPVTILTDQCQAMRAAISEVLPRTRHRWCRWHVLRNAKESLGGIYSKNSEFKRDFHTLIDEFMLEHEFEARWHSLINKFGLAENQFLDRAFTNRAMWAKPYFADTFCAGMTSTQRSESANHMLKTYIPRAAPMHLFVSNYNRMAANREADEGKEEHATKQGRRALKTGVPIEKHDAKIYTRAMFDKFSDELFRSGSFYVQVDEDPSIYLVQKFSDNDHGDAECPIFTVAASPDQRDFFCQCKMFEHSGLPCRHILKVVLTHACFVSIPDDLICKRWTKNAKDGFGYSYSAEERNKRVQDAGTMHAFAYASAMELVSMCRSSRQAFELGVDLLGRAKEAITSITVVSDGSVGITADAEANGSCVTGDMQSAALPPIVRSRGRPKQSPEDSNERGDELADNKSGRGKSRKCHACGEYGHYRSTCGRLVVQSVQEVVLADENYTSSILFLIMVEVDSVCAWDMKRKQVSVYGKPMDGSLYMEVLALQFAKTFDGVRHETDGNEEDGLTRIRQELLYDVLHIKGNRGALPAQFVQVVD